jgi:hypothetical protein
LRAEVVLAAGGAKAAADPARAAKVTR